MYFFNYVYADPLPKCRGGMFPLPESASLLSSVGNCIPCVWVKQGWAGVAAVELITGLQAQVGTAPCSSDWASRIWERHI